jgi:hypothetical protein
MAAHLEQIGPTLQVRRLESGRNSRKFHTAVWDTVGGPKPRVGGFGVVAGYGMWLRITQTLCQPVQPRRPLLRSDPAGAADPGDADPLLRQQRRGPAGAAVQPRHAQDSDRAECGLKIFGIAVGLLILMATVALLSMQMTRTVDGQLAIMPSRLT